MPPQGSDQEKNTKEIKPKIPETERTPEQQLDSLVEGARQNIKQKTDNFDRRQDATKQAMEGEPFSTQGAVELEGIRTEAGDIETESARRLAASKEGAGVEMKGIGEILIEDVDLSEGVYDEDKIKTLVEHLRASGLEPEKFLYSGFGTLSIPQLLKTGSYTDRATIYCAPFKELTSTSNNDQNPLEYAEEHFENSEEYPGDSPALAVLRPDSLVLLTDDEVGEHARAGYAYRLKPDATPAEAIERILRLKLYKRSDLVNPEAYVP